MKKVARYLPWVFYLLLIAALFIASSKFIKYAAKCLEQYELSQPKYFLDDYVKMLSEKSPKELADILTFPPVNDRFTEYVFFTNSYAENILSGELSWIERGGTYKLCHNGEAFAEIKLEESSRETKLWILTIHKWKVSEVKVYEIDTYNYELKFPSTYSVSVNGKSLDPSELVGQEEIEGYEYIKMYKDMPVMLFYRIDGLIMEPVFEVLDNNGDLISAKAVDGKLHLEPVFYPREFDNDIDINPLEILETWSLFLLKDLDGPLNGLEKARKYFIKDSYLWNMAYDFATGIDIHYMDYHVLGDFTNESVSEFIRYTDDAFSCIVYFETNFTIYRAQTKPVRDVFHSRVYFVRYDDTDDGADNPRWLIAGMQTLSNKNDY